MLPCVFKSQGCSQVFERRYGLQIHLRSCIHKQRRGQVRKKIKLRYHLPVDLYDGKKTSDEITSRKMELEASTIESEDEWNDHGIHDMFPYIQPNQEHEDRELSTLDTVMVKLGHMSRSAGRRSVSELIRLLHRNDFSLESFRGRCRTAKDCTELEDNVLFSNLEEQDFKKVTIKDSDSGIECDLYIRSLIAFLRKQLESSSVENTIFSPTQEFPNDGKSHPMLARLGKEGVPAVIDTIMSQLQEEILWCTTSNSGGRSFVGMLQLFSDKSRTTLKEAAFQFYPFHVTLLNFNDDYRRQCILNGLSLVAFLPVTFYRTIDGERIKSGLSRLERLKMLHLSIDHVLSELKDVAYKGFTCVDKNSTLLVCHPCLGSYCCDLPEGKDLTSVKNGNSSLRNCHRCIAKTDNFNLYTRERPRRGEESVSVLEKASNLRRKRKGQEADELLYEQSLVEQISCLQSFPFVGSTSVLDMHAIFNFEPLHNFHLGASKELKRCLSERLRSDEHFSTVVPTKGGNKRNASFKTLRLSILFGINRMLAHIQTFSPAKGLRIDFSTSSKESFGSGLYVDDGKLVGMLEAKDYKVIDMVSPFIGMLVDRCCDEVTKAPTTNLFVMYVDIMQMAMSYNGNSMLWTEEMICKLERKIELFKENALCLYGKYHASKLRTEKFHQLDHICDDIRTMGGLRTGDAGIYEHEHTDIKRANRSGSRKNHTAMTETVSSYVKEKYYKSNKATLNEGSVRGKETTLSANKNAIEYDSVFLVKTGKVFTVGDIDRGRRLMRRIRIATDEECQKNLQQLNEEMNTVDKNVRDILNDVGEVGCRVLVNELMKISVGNGRRLNTDSLIRRVASGYISGIQAPTSANYDKRWNKIRVPRSSTRYSQRMISTRGFSGSSLLRQDSVLVQASDPSSSGSLSLWVGKVLGLFHIPFGSDPILDPDGNKVEEFAFLQFYDASPPTDNIDKALGCIKLVWATAQQGSRQALKDVSRSNDFVSPWFSLLPVTTIRGVVHVVRGDYGKDGLCVVKDMDSVPWHKQVFYINRFYFDSDVTEHQYQGDYGSADR